jgi:hypothetical protein
MKRIILPILSLLLLTQFATANQLCSKLFDVSYQQLLSELKSNWSMPKPGTKDFFEYVQKLPMAMQTEIQDIGSWDKKRTAMPRLPVAVARLSEVALSEMSHPRLHRPLPSFNKKGELFFPDHIKLDLNKNPIASEDFFVRMMVIKDKGSDRVYLPRQLEHLKPFIEKTIQLEMERDPEGFKKRYAYIQVDSSWVQAEHNQPRPGKTTTQAADPKKRQGAHVDGFLTEDYWKMKEDITYSTSTGFNSKNKNNIGDAIPTEFFDIGFPIPENLTHAQARIIYDTIANSNPDNLVLLPSGLINRMSSRVVHRVGVAKEDTYRTFVKIKFSDEAFNQVENTVNVDQNGVLAPIYQAWKARGIPLVDRKTLPTEGLIEEVDRPYFQSNRKTLDGEL